MRHFHVWVATPDQPLHKLDEHGLAPGMAREVAGWLAKALDDAGVPQFRVEVRNDAGEPVWKTEKPASDSASAGL